MDMDRAVNLGEGRRKSQDRKLDIKVMFCVCWVLVHVMLQVVEISRWTAVQVDV